MLQREIIPVLLMLFLPVSRWRFLGVFSVGCSLYRMAGLSYRRNGYCWHGSRRCSSTVPSISCRFLCLTRCFAGSRGISQNLQCQYPDVYKRQYWYIINNNHICKYSCYRLPISSYAAAHRNAAARFRFTMFTMFIMFLMFYYVFIYVLIFNINIYIIYKHL